MMSISFRPIDRALTTLALGGVLGMAATAQAQAAQSASPLVSGHEYVVTAHHPNDLTFVDAQTDTLFKTCSLPERFNPGTLQMSPDHSVVYILNNNMGDLYGVSVDSCDVVFHASLNIDRAERSKAMFSIAVSRDGKEIYSIVNPTHLGAEAYEVLTPRLLVFSTSDGLSAKPIRKFSAPRQTTMIQVGNDGALYVVGADVYKIDPQTGRTDVEIPLRNWKRAGFGAPDVLYIWPSQTPMNTLDFLYTAPRFKDEKQDPATADVLYGLASVNLTTGKSELVDFADFAEVYFTAARSPKDSNILYAVLKHLGKYDMAQKKQLANIPLDHSYYTVSSNHDGSKLYLAGAANDIAVYDADTLKKIANIKLTGDMSITTPQVFVR